MVAGWASRAAKTYLSCTAPDIRHWTSQGSSCCFSITFQISLSFISSVAKPNWEPPREGSSGKGSFSLAKFKQYKTTPALYYTCTSVYVFQNGEKIFSWLNVSWKICKLKSVLAPLSLCQNYHTCEKHFVRESTAAKTMRNEVLLLLLSDVDAFVRLSWRKSHTEMCRNGPLISQGCAIKANTQRNNITKDG